VRRPILLLLSFCLLAAEVPVIHGAHGPQIRSRADLVVQGNCSTTTLRNGERRPAVQIVVKNIGYATALASTTGIVFPDLPKREPYTFPTVSLQPGKTSEMYMVIPSSCLGQLRCRFTIVADVNHEVTEIKEDNNRDQSYCRGRVKTPSN
jgi:subtilase family serine protease